MTETDTKRILDPWKRQAIRSQSMPVGHRATTDDSDHNSGKYGHSSASSPQPPASTGAITTTTTRSHNSAPVSGGAFGRFVRDLIYGSSQQTTATTAHSHQQVQVISRSPPDTSHGFSRSLSTISEPVQITSGGLPATSTSSLVLCESPTESSAPTSPLPAPHSTPKSSPYVALRRGQRHSTSSFVLAASPVEEHSEYTWTTMSPTTRFSRGGQVKFTHVDPSNHYKRGSTLSLDAMPSHGRIEDSEVDHVQKTDRDEQNTESDKEEMGSWWFGRKPLFKSRSKSYISGSITPEQSKDNLYTKPRHSIAVFPRSPMTLGTFNDPYPPRSPMHTGTSHSSTMVPPPQVDLIGRYSDCPRVLTTRIASQLRLKLPPLQRLSRRWSLLYSLDQHGISFTTMLNRVENKGPIILAIQDEENKIFGGYATESFKPHIGCYGSGECFLWQLDQDPSNGKDKLEVYSWTGKNDYSIMTEPNYIAMGVDNGKFGLWIDSSFDNGSSMPCATFDNPQLSTHETFTCAHIEIWALQ